MIKHFINLCTHYTHSFFTLLLLVLHLNHFIERETLDGVTSSKDKLLFSTLLVRL